MNKFFVRTENGAITSLGATCFGHNDEDNAIKAAEALSVTNSGVVEIYRGELIGTVEKDNKPKFERAPLQDVVDDTTKKAFSQEGETRVQPEGYDTNLDSQ